MTTYVCIYICIYKRNTAKCMYVNYVNEIINNNVYYILK